MNGYTITPDNVLAFQAISAKRVIDGISRQKYRKEIVKAGTFVKESDGIEFNITQDQLHNWVAQFGRMRDAGVSVPIPSTHEGAADPDKQRGQVLDLFVDGESLFMSCELIGDDAITAAARNDVSIYSPPSFVDGKGVEYARPITHVALCPDPVVPGLSPFIPIAASRKRSRSLSMDLTKIGKALGLTETLTDENAEAMILSHGKAIATKLSTAQSDLKAANGTIATMKADGKAEPVKPDAMLLRLAADNRNMKLDALVTGGRLTPATRDKLKGMFIGDNNVALELILSHRTDDKFDELIAALAENDVVDLQQKTGPQSDRVVLSRTDGNSNALLADADARGKGLANGMRT